MNAPSESFLFVNKSTSSRTLSRSKAKEKAEIFRHVQRVRQQLDGQRPKHAARVDIPIRTFESCWALPGAKSQRTPFEHEESRRTRNSTPDVTQSDDVADDILDSAVTEWQTPAIQWFRGDGFDPFESFPKMASYLPVTGNCPSPVKKARSHLFSYIESLELTEFARKERLFHALVRPTVMFSHLMMIVMETEMADQHLGRNLDRIFGTGALRHVCHEIQQLQDRCPWDLICLVYIFMLRAQASGRADVAKAHRRGLIAMIEHNGGLRAFAATNDMAQGGANGSLIGELLASAITGEPLHPVLGDLAAGGNFSKHSKEKAPISPLHCKDGDFSELGSSPLSSPETIQLLGSMWLLVQSVTQPARHPILGKNSASDYYRARKAILGSFEIVPLKEARDYMYECCRLTATLLLNATENHLPLSSCVANYPVVYRLEHLLKSQELSGSRGAFKGVYLNVIIVAYIASLGTSSSGYFHGLLGHPMGYYACGVWEGAYGPLITLKRFQDFCRSQNTRLFP